MAIYSYSCSCGAKAERLVQKMDEPIVCLECGKQMTMVWSVPSPAQWSCSKGSL